MKNTLSVIGFLAVLTGGFFACNGLGTDTVSNRKFDKTHEHLQKEIDSLKLMQVVISHNQDTMRNNQDTIRTNQSRIIQNQNTLFGNQDSLKKGQEIIYNHITKRAENPTKQDGKYFENLINFYK